MRLYYTFLILFFLIKTAAAQRFAPVILTSDFDAPPPYDSCFMGVVMQIHFDNEPDTSRPSESVHYPWLPAGSYDVEHSLARRVFAPECYRRVPVEKGSFAEWLRFLPLDTFNEKILFFDYCEKPDQTGLHQIINIDIGHENLQQCADAAMRLISEYHYSRRQYDRIYFNFTSGHKVSFDDWRKGRQARVAGHRRVYFITPTAADTVNNSRQNLKAYFSTLFTYAGSYSLSMELKKKPLDSLAAGDLFVRGGFPGHVVLIVDVAVHPQTGHKVFLMLQGGMPAQHVHIFNNPNDAGLSPWYSADIGGCLVIPGYDFERDMLYGGGR